MANLGFIGFSIIILVVGLIALVIFALRKIFGEREDPKNENIIINGLSNYCDGYGLMLQKDKKSNKEVIGIKGSPRDLDYIKLKTKKFKVKNQKIYVRKDLLIPLGFSAHRKMYLALPDKPEQLPNELKESWLGKYIMEGMKEQNKKMEEQKIEEIQSKSNYILMKEKEGLKRAVKLLEQNSEATGEIMKSQVQPTPKKEDGK